MDTQEKEKIETTNNKYSPLRNRSRTRRFAKFNIVYVVVVVVGVVGGGNGIVGWLGMIWSTSEMREVSE
jgi:nitrate reductase NapE component